MKNCESCKNRPEPGAAWSETACARCSPWEPRDRDDGALVRVPEWVIDALPRESSAMKDTLLREIIDLTADGTLTRVDHVIMSAIMRGYTGYTTLARECGIGRARLRYRLRRLRNLLADVSTHTASLV